MTMTPLEYGDILVRDHLANVARFIGGRHMLFFALYMALVDCDTHLDSNRNHADNYVFFVETRLYLATKFRTYCIENKKEIENLIALK